MSSDFQNMLALFNDPAALDNMVTQLSGVMPAPIEGQGIPGISSPLPQQPVSGNTMLVQGPPQQAINPAQLAPPPPVAPVAPPAQLGVQPTPGPDPQFAGAPAGGIPQTDPLGAAATGQKPQPLPPSSPAELEQRKGGWMSFINGIKTDPTKQQMLLKIGIAMMQPRPQGQSTVGHLGQAVGQGADYLAASKAAQSKQTLEAAKTGAILTTADAAKTSAETGKAGLLFKETTANAAKLQAEAADYRARNPLGRGGSESKTVQNINQIATALAAQREEAYKNSPKLTSGPNKGLPAQAILDAQTLSKAKSPEEVAAGLLQRSLNGLESPEEHDQKVLAAVEQAQAIWNHFNSAGALRAPAGGKAPAAANNDPLGLRAK